MQRQEHLFTMHGRTHTGQRAIRSMLWLSVLRVPDFPDRKPNNSVPAVLIYWIS